MVNIVRDIHGSERLALASEPMVRAERLQKVLVRSRINRLRMHPGRNMQSPVVGWRFSHVTWYSGYGPRPSKAPEIKLPKDKTSLARRGTERRGEARCFCWGCWA